MLLLFVQATLSADLVSYAGSSANERFYGAFELSDGTILVCGKAANLDWIPSSVPRIQLASKTANDSAVPPTDPLDANQGTLSFIIRLNAAMTQIQKVYHFPPGIGGAITRIKTNSVPSSTTGDIYISGKWTNSSSTTPNSCWVGKLDNNFIKGDPSKLVWIGEWYVNQPENFNYNLWDVGNDGKIVYYAYKRPSAGAWGAVYRLKSDGSKCDSVPKWWNHGDMCISFKPDNYNMRSQTQADYDLVTSHSGKGKKKGKYPHDFYFAGPLGVTNNAGGYTGYKSDGTASTSFGIAIDKRDNAMYIGFNTPCANNTHDFEPTIMRMEPNGALTWYSHMYDEWTDVNNNEKVDAGETHQCPPDQYVDGVAIDYSKPITAPEIIVLARSHGNAPQNFWNGTNSFHNGFTGTNGNEHLCWLGRFKGLSGDFVNASWNAEYDPWSKSFGTAYADPILDGWPSHNSGWSSLKSTPTHNITCDAQGNIYCIADSRGPVTTSNAFQKAPNPLSGQFGCWTDFVRVYAPDFSTLRYSSMLAGPCEVATGNGGENVKLCQVIPVSTGLITVGYHIVDAQGLAKGQPAPTASVPSWGKATVLGEDGILAKLDFSKPVLNALPQKLSKGSIQNVIQIFQQGSLIHLRPKNSTEPYSVYIYTMQGQLSILYKKCRGPSNLTLPHQMAVLKFIQKGKATAFFINNLSK